MIKTVNLTAETETEVILTGGCHCCIENRGSGTIYASKTSGIIADSDGVTAISGGSAKVLRNIAQYRKDNGTYDYYGKIYLLSDEDAKAEIQTANDLNFSKSSGSGSGAVKVYDDTAIKADISALQSGIIDLQTEKADKSEVYTMSETDSKIIEKVAEIVADAPEDFNTLKEMSDWIANHENSASAMNSAIQTNADNISNLQENKANTSDLNNYVTKVTGKGLSTNDYTTAEKNKLASLKNYANATTDSDGLMSKSDKQYLSDVRFGTWYNVSCPDSAMWYIWEIDWYKMGNIYGYDIKLMPASDMTSNKLENAVPSEMGIEDSRRIGGVAIVDNFGNSRVIPVTFNSTYINFLCDTSDLPKANEVVHMFSTFVAPWYM